MSDQCEQSVMRGFHMGRCSRAAVRGGFCTQHHPENVAERDRKQKERVDTILKMSSNAIKLSDAHVKIHRLQKQLDEQKEVIEALDFSWEKAKQRWHKAETKLDAVKPWLIHDYGCSAPASVCICGLQQALEQE